MSNYFVSETALNTRDSILIIVIIIIEATTRLHRNSLQDNEVPWENRQ